MDYNNLVAPVITGLKGKSQEEINFALTKIAEENHLSDDGRQRLVEAYNIDTFLNNMQEGVHHEDFELASPVKVEGEMTKEGALLQTHLSKVANSSLCVTPDMFCLLEKDELFLSKTASVNTGSNREVFNDRLLMNSEKKWRSIDNEKRLLLAKEAIDKEKAGAIGDILSVEQKFAQAISRDASLVKTAMVLAVDDSLLTDTIMENTNFIPLEIQHGVVSESSIQKIAKIAKEVAPGGISNTKAIAGIAALATAYELSKEHDFEYNTKERQKLMIP